MQNLTLYISSERGYAESDASASMNCCREMDWCREMGWTGIGTESAAGCLECICLCTSWESRLII